MKILMALLAGVLFGLGLLVSGMSNPAKVLGFLDLAGKWDPSLAFVMCGAVGVGALAFPFVSGRPASLLGEPLRLPTATSIDRPLVLGGLMFGVGWGLAGFCPGPALASLGRGAAEAGLFVVAMLAGMALFAWRERAKAASGPG